MLTKRRFKVFMQREEAMSSEEASFEFDKQFEMSPRYDSDRDDVLVVKVKGNT